MAIWTFMRDWAYDNPCVDGHSPCRMAGLGHHRKTSDMCLNRPLK